MLEPAEGVPAAGVQRVPLETGRHGDQSSAYVRAWVSVPGTLESRCQGVQGVGGWGFKGVAGDRGAMSKEEIVRLILLMKGLDVDYAREVLKREHARQPELGLIEAVRAAMKPC